MNLKISKICKMQRQTASADSFGIRLADYSRQNDTVFKLSAENKHWKRKYIEELELRSGEETLRKNEWMSLHADIAAMKEKAKVDEKEWRLREFESSQEYSRAEEDFQNKQGELTTKLKDMKFKHGIDMFALEERFDKEVKEIRNSCDKMEQDRQQEWTEFKARMKAQLDEARSESERLAALVSKLEEEREVDKMTAEMANSSYIDMLREKEAEYDRLKERFVRLGKENDRVVREAKETEERLMKEFQAKEAAMLRDAEERRKNVLKERREAAGRESRVVREAKSRVEEARAESERHVTELNRVSELVQSDLREEFEERILKMRGESGKQGMRLLNASKEREDQLKVELAREVELRRSVEEDAQRQIEEYQGLARERDHLSERLSMEKAGREVDRGDALREKAGLDSLIEQQTVEFQRDRETLETEKHQQECVSQAERKTIVKMYDDKLADMATRHATLEHQLQESDAKRTGEALKMSIKQNRQIAKIEVLGNKLRHQKDTSVTERGKLEGAWRAEKNDLNQKYKRLKAVSTAALSDQEMLFGIRIEGDQKRYEMAKAKAAEEHDRLVELIGVYRTALDDFERKQADEVRVLEARREEDESKGTLERKKLSGMVAELRAKCTDQDAMHEQEIHELEDAWENERGAWVEKYDSMNAELEQTKMAYDMELGSEEGRRLEENTMSFEKSEQLIQVIGEYKVLLGELQSNHEHEQRQLEATYKERLAEQEKQHEAVLADLTTQWYNFEKRVEDEVDYCDGLEIKVAELKRKREWQAIGTKCWLAIMKRHHKVDLDGMKGRRENSEELSVEGNSNRTLLKSVEKQEATDTAQTDNHKAEVELLRRRVETSEINGMRHSLRMDRRYVKRRNRGCQATEEKIAAELAVVQSTSVQCGDEGTADQSQTTDIQDITNDTKMPKEDEKSLQESESRPPNVVRHYNLEEVSSAEKEESDTKPLGVEKSHRSVMDRVYRGPPRDPRADLYYRHGPPSQHFYRPPPPGYRPMRPPHPVGRPHPRMGPPPPYGPRPHGPGYGPPPPRGPRPGFYRPPHRPYGQPPHNGPRRQ